MAPACPPSRRSRAATPEKSLVEKGRNKAGRNVHGRITTRHHGGGNKNRYRVIDFKRNKDGMPAKVAHIEYDPNRSARIALLHYADGEKRYILAPQGVVQGDRLMSGPDAEIRPGNALPLRNIPVGTVIHAIETEARRGRQDGALGRHQRPAHGEGGLHGHPAPSLGGDASDPGRLQGHGRRGGQPRARARSRSARPGVHAGRTGVRRCEVWR